MGGGGLLKEHVAGSLPSASIHASGEQTSVQQTWKNERTRQARDPSLCYGSSERQMTVFEHCLTRPSDMTPVCCQAYWAIHLSTQVHTLNIGTLQSLRSDRSPGGREGSDIPDVGPKAAVLLWLGTTEDLYFSNNESARMGYLQVFKAWLKNL